MTQEQLVERCVQGDRNAWDEFVLEHRSLVKRSVYYKLGRMNYRSLLSEVDDIVQEVFLMLWHDNKLSSVRDISRLKGWLAIVAKNKTVSYAETRWKKEKKQKSIDSYLTEEGFTLGDVLSSGDLEQEKILEAKEMKEHLFGEKSKLNRKERRAFELQINGEKQREIAGIMGLSEGTVATVISRARVKARRVLQECFAL